MSSKKGGNVPKPDKRLVAAQLKSMGIQDAAIEQVMQIATEQEAANARLRPMQEEAMRFGLEADKTGYAQSQADRGWLLGRRDQLTGMQDQMLGDAKAFNVESAGQTAANAAQADVTASYDNVAAARSRELAGMGVNPGSGRFAGMQSGIDLDKARALAGAANAGRVQARSEGRMLTDRASNALAGYPAQSMQATGQGAGIASNGINNANAGAGGINAGYGAMTGTLSQGGNMAAQLGQNATSMYGTQANAYAQAQDQKGELFGSVLGAGATLGAAYL